MPGNMTEVVLGVETGWAIRDKKSGKYWGKPARGSGGICLYQTEKKAKQGLMLHVWKKDTLDDYEVVQVQIIVRAS